MKNNIAIKGKIVDFDDSLFGLFLAIFNVTEKTLQINAIAGKSGFIAFYDLSALHAEAVLMTMEELFSRGEVNVKDSKKLEEFIRQNEDIFFKLFERDNYKQSLEMILTAKLKSYYNVSSVKVTIDLDQLITDVPYRDIIQIAIDKEKQEESDVIRKEFSVHFTLDIIECNPIYAPSSGTLIGQIAKGDVIACIPAPEYAKNVEILEKYNLLDEQGELKKISATVQKIKKSNEGYTIIAAINKDLISFLTIIDGVKIEKIDDDVQEMSYQNQIRDEETGEKLSPSEKSNSNVMTAEKIREYLQNYSFAFYIIIFLTLLCMFFILYYYLN